MVPLDTMVVQVVEVQTIQMSTQTQLYTDKTVKQLGRMLEDRVEAHEYMLLVNDMRFNTLVVVAAVHLTEQTVEMPPASVLNRQQEVTVQLELSVQPLPTTGRAVVQETEEAAARS